MKRNAKITTVATAMMMCAATMVAHGQQAITFCGGDAVGNGDQSSLSYSCGEVAVKRAEARSITVVNVTQYFTEGVQQAFSTKPMGITTALNVSLSIYPNPTDKGVIMEAEDGSGVLEYTLYGATGQVMKSGRYEGGKEWMDMSGMAAGNYMLQVKAENGAGQNMYKIIKTN